MNGLPPFSYVLWINGKGVQARDVTHTHGCSPSRSHITKDMGQEFTGYANHQAGRCWILDVMLGKSAHGWVAIYSTCLVGALIRSDNPQTQPVHWDAVHLSNIAPKLRDQT